MDQEELAAGDTAIRGHPNEAVEAALVACRRQDEASGNVATDSRELNDFVRVSGARSEDQQPRQSSGNSGTRSGRVHIAGATTASVSAARVRQHEQGRQAPSRPQFEGRIDDDDVIARDFREFDHFVKMHLQQKQKQTQQLLTRLQQQPLSPSSTEGGGEVAPARASLDLELRL